MNKQIKQFFWAFCFIMLFWVASCHKDDNGNHLETIQVEPTKSITRIVSANDIPAVMDFISLKTDSKMQFIINETNSELRQNRNHEDNLVLTNTTTEQIKQVTNGFGKSNYTFKLVEEGDKEGVYFLNLVVKEYKDTFYLYIAKYVPDANWVENYSNSSSFSTFTGTIYFYNDQGIYVAKYDMINGTSATFEKHPCTTNGTSNGSSGDSNGNTSGDSSGSTGTTSGTGTAGSEGTGSGQEIGDCLVIIETWDSSCGCQYVEIHTCDDYYGDGDKSLSELLRHPCNPDSGSSSDVVNPDGDCVGQELDCEYGYDYENCECLDEPNESDDVGVNIDFGVISELNSLLGDGDSFEINNNLQEDEVLYFSSVAEFSDYLESLENSFILDEVDVVQNTDGTKVTKFKAKFNLPIPVYLNVHAKAELDDVNTEDTDEYDLVDVVSFETGITPFLDWEQNSYEHQVDGNHVTVTIYGQFDIGINIEGLPLSYSDSYAATVIIDTQTGEAIDMSVTSDN